MSESDDKYEYVDEDEDLEDSEGRPNLDAILAKALERCVSGTVGPGHQSRPPGRALSQTLVTKNYRRRLRRRTAAPYLCRRNGLNSLAVIAQPFSSSNVIGEFQIV